MGGGERKKIESARTEKSSMAEIDLFIQYNVPCVSRKKTFSTLASCKFDYFFLVL